MPDGLYGSRVTLDDFDEEFAVTLRATQWQRLIAATWEQGNRDGEQGNYGLQMAHSEIGHAYKEARRNA